MRFEDVKSRNPQAEVISKYFTGALKARTHMH